MRIDPNDKETNRFKQNDEMNHRLPATLATITPLFYFTVVASCLLAITFAGGLHNAAGEWRATCEWRARRL